MGSRVSVLKEATFAPPRWAAGPHAQTLMARMLRPETEAEVIRERLETPDGDFFDVDWSPLPHHGAPIVAVLHGLEGSSSRKYVRSVCRQLHERGLATVAMNFRGCSGEANRSLSFYHSGDTRDLNQLVEVVRTRHPSSALGAVGFSLGGNVLLKTMGERADGGCGLLDAAAVMSVPYDLAAGSALLGTTRMGKLYTAYFMRSLRHKVEQKRDLLATVIDLDEVDRARSIWDFDERVTAPLHGFADASEYYAQCSSRRFLPDIQVSTLMIHAVDDPFLPPDAIPRSEADGNEALTLRLSAHGGHVGFLCGTPWAPVFWGEMQAAEFLAGRLRLVQRP